MIAHILMTRMTEAPALEEIKDIEGLLGIAIFEEGPYSEQLSMVLDTFAKTREDIIQVLIHAVQCESGPKMTNEEIRAAIREGRIMPRTLSIRPIDIDGEPNLEESKGVEILAGIILKDTDKVLGPSAFLFGTDISKETRLIIDRIMTQYGIIIAKYANLVRETIGEPQDFRVTINCSQEMLESDDFVSYITGLVDEHDVDTENIVFELLEDIKPGVLKKNIHKIKALNELGVDVAIDDLDYGPIYQWEANHSVQLLEILYDNNIAPRYIKFHGSMSQGIQGYDSDDPSKQMDAREWREGCKSLIAKSVAAGAKAIIFEGYYGIDESILTVLRELRDELQGEGLDIDIPILLEAYLPEAKPDIKQ